MHTEPDAHDIALAAHVKRSERRLAEVAVNEMMDTVPAAEPPVRRSTPVPVKK